MPTAREQEKGGENAGPPYDHPKLQRLYEYWLAKKRGAKLPGRKDIDPLDIPDLLPAMVLVDVVRAGEAARFRLRLLGTEYTEHNHRDLTGAWVDEAHEPARAAEIIQTYEKIVTTRAPHYWRNALHSTGREHIGYERLMCPLAADGETVDMLIGVFAFETA